jgi:hypothetical protein
MIKSTVPKTTALFNSNPMKLIYLLLIIVGSIAPWYWLLQDPAKLLSPSSFLQAAFANNIAAAFATDLLFSVAAFFCFAWIELKRLGVSRLWLLLYIGLTFGVGLSCALPCYLYRREQILERNALRPQTT